MYIVFDTETTGKALNFSAPITDFNNWPRLVQIAWKVFDGNGVEIDSQNLLIKPQGFSIPVEATKIHRISDERAKNEGILLRNALEKFGEAVRNNKYLVAHNISFDENVVGCELLREGMHNYVPDISHIDTMILTTEFVGIINTRRGGFKWPSLMELYEKLFLTQFIDAHDALADVAATAKCFFELQERGILGFKQEISQENLIESLSKMTSEAEIEVGIKEFKSFVPMGVHTFHSILEGTGSIDEYIKSAKKYNHPAIAITDNSTLSGTFEFFQKCKSKGIKPVLGIEILINDNVGKFEDRKLEGDNYKVKILIKNEQGYKNLNHLLYLSNTEGYFNKEARITTEWLIKYKDGLILSTSGLDSKLASMALRGVDIDAEKYLNMLRNEFGEDLFVELQFSKFHNQKLYNNFLIKMITKYKLLPIVSNDTYYVEKEDSILQDVVTSIKSHRPLHFCSLKENRDMFYFSSNDYSEMNSKYNFGYPESFIELCINNTLKIAEKCVFQFETNVEKYPKYEPTQDVIDYFKSDDTKEIIVKLSFAKLRQKIKKYQENGLVIIDEAKIQEYNDRLNYEIEVIESKKMLDYFLVNWEMINNYRKQGYEIGAGRGCFVSGSRVKMADGMYSPIDVINIGDTVIDAYGDERVVVDTLEYDIEEDIVELEFEDGRMIKCTLDHEFLTKNHGWVKAIELNESDDIVDVNELGK